MLELTADIYAWLTSIDLLNPQQIDENEDVRKSSEEYVNEIRSSITNFTINEKGNVLLQDPVNKTIYSGFFFVRLFNKINEQLNILYGNIYKKDDRISNIINDNTPSIKLKNFEIISSILKNYYGIMLESDFKTLLVAGDISSFQNLFERLYHFYLEVEEKIKKTKKEETSKIKQPTDGNILANSDKFMKISFELNNDDYSDYSKLHHREDFIEDFNNLSKPLSQTRGVLEYFLVLISKSFNLQGKQSASLLADGKKYLTYIIVKGLSKKNFEPVKQFYQEVLQNMTHLISLIQINSIAFPNQISKNIETTLSTLKIGLLSKNIDVVFLSSRVLCRVSYELTENNLISFAWNWFISQGGLEATIMSIKKHNSTKDSVVSLFANFGRFHFYELFAIHLKNNFENEGGFFDFLSDIIEPLSNLQLFTEAFSKQNLKEFILEMTLESASSYNLNTRLQTANFISELWINFSFYLEEENENNQLLNTLKKLSRDANRLVQYSAITGLFKVVIHFAKERNFFAPIIYKSLTFMLIENHSKSELKEFMISNFANLFKEIMSIPVSILVEPYIKQINLSLGNSYFFNLIDINFLFSLTKHPRMNVKDAIIILDVLGKVYFEIESGIFLYSLIRNVFAVILSRYLFHEVGVEFCFKYVKLLIETFCKLDKPFSDKIYINSIEYNVNPEDRMNLIKPPEREDLQKYITFFDTHDLLNLTKSAILEILLDILNINNTFINKIIKSHLVFADLRHFKIFSFHNIGLAQVIDYFGNSSEIVHYYNINKQELDLDREFEIVIELIYDKPPFVEKPSINLQVPEKKSNNKESNKIISEKSILVKSKENFPKDEKSKSILKNTPKILKNNLTLVDLSQEEDRDIIHLKKVIKEYHRFFKHIFTKYCGSIYHPVKGKLFNSIKEITETMTSSEVIKMYKEHEIIPSMISKEELLLIIGVLNSKIFKKSNLKSGLNFDEFQDLFVQIAFFVFNRPPHNYAKYSVAGLTLEMIKLFAQNVKDINGVSPVDHADYLHPDDLMNADEASICKEINAKLKISNSQTVIPNGYKKFLETDILHKFFVPDCMRTVFTQSKIICLEIMDEIVNKISGNHILESFVYVKEQYKVRPAFLPVKVKSFEDEIQLLKEQKRGRQKNQKSENMLQENKNFKRLKEAISSKNIKSKNDDSNQDEFKNSIKNSQNNSIKNSIKNLKSKSKSKSKSPILTEESLIKDPILNETKIKKLLEDEKNKLKEKEKEKKRKLRVQYIKQELEKMKESKREKEIKREEFLKEEKRRQEEKIKRKLEAESILREKIKSEINKIKKIKQDEEIKKIDQKRKNNLNSAKKKSERNDVFVNIQIAKLQDEFRKKVDKRKLEVAKNRLEKKFKEEKLLEEKRKFDEFLLREKKTNEVEKKLHQEIEKLKDKADISTILEVFGEHLNLLSNIYTSTKNTEINKNISNSSTGIHLEDFLLFCSHFNITHALLENDEIHYIYKKIVGKENCLTPLKFKMAILYISLFSLSHFKQNIFQPPVDQGINKINYYNKLNKFSSLDGEVLNSFFTSIGFNLPFNRKEIESYINLQRNLNVKDKQKIERFKPRLPRSVLKKSKLLKSNNTQYSESKYSQSPKTNNSPNQSMSINVRDSDSKPKNKLWEKRNIDNS